MPFFIPLMQVLWSFIMHVFAIKGVLDRLLEVNLSFKREHSYFWAILFIFIVLGFFLYRNRHKHILEKAKQMSETPTWVSIVILAIYFLGNFGIAVLAGLYKNQDWLFAS